jgi:hypothetical protein
VADSLDEAKAAFRAAWEAAEPGRPLAALIGSSSKMDIDMSGGGSIAVMRLQRANSQARDPLNGSHIEEGNNAQ